MLNGRQESRRLKGQRPIKDIRPVHRERIPGHSRRNAAQATWGKLPPVSAWDKTHSLRRKRMCPHPFGCMHLHELMRCPSMSLRDLPCYLPWPACPGCIRQVPAPANAAGQNLRKGKETLIQTIRFRRMENVPNGINKDYRPRQERRR